jgi:hypothetical protein
MKQHKKIETIIKSMAIISIIYGFFHEKIFDEIVIYLMVVSIQFLISLLILNYLNPVDSMLRNPLILLAALIISGVTFWFICFELINLKTPSNAKKLSHWTIFLSSFSILILSLIQISKSYYFTFKKSDKTRRTEIALLGICFVLNIVGIFLNVHYVLLSIILFGLGLTILLSPIFLLNFIFLDNNISFKWFFIFYLISTNAVTLFFILEEPSLFKEPSLFRNTEFIWPLINIITGVIWAILLLLNQNTCMENNVDESKESNLKVESQTNKI